MIAELIVLTIIALIVLSCYLTYRSFTKTPKQKSINLEDKLPPIEKRKMQVERFKENRLKNIRLQEIEDEQYYNQIKAEADRQVYNVTVRGWIERNGMWSNSIHQNWKIEEAYLIEKSGNRL